MTNDTSFVVEIEGQRFELNREDWEGLDCIQINDTTFHLLDNGHAYVITLIASNAYERKYSLEINGENKEATILNSLDILIEKMGLKSAQSKKLSMLHAPMPGLVAAVKASAGQEVEKGSPLIILEAMKMENVIVAPHHAIIKKINVEVGQAVEKGFALVEFEKE